MFKRLLSLMAVMVLIASCSPTPIRMTTPSPSPTRTTAVAEPLLLTPTRPSVNSDWSGYPARLIFTLVGHIGSVRALAFSPQGQLVASGGEDSMILLWDVRTGNILKRLPGHQSTVNALTFSADGTLLISGSDDRTVRVWDVGTGTPIKVFEGHDSGVTAVAISPDNKIIASGSRNYAIGNTFYTNSGQVRVWNAETGEMISAWNIGEIAFVSFWSQGAQLAAYTKGKIYKFNAPFKQEPWSIGLNWGGDVDGLALSPDEKVLATSVIDIMIWNTETGQLLKSINGLHTDIQLIESLAYSPDGKLLVGGCTDGFERIWDVASGQLLGELPGDRTGFIQVAFSPDSKMFASAGYDGTVLLWRLK